jgi:hypothetical protein
MVAYEQRGITTESERRDPERLVIGTYDVIDSPQEQPPVPAVHRCFDFLWHGSIQQCIFLHPSHQRSQSPRISSRYDRSGRISDKLHLLVQKKWVLFHFTWNGNKIVLIPPCQRKNISREIHVPSEDFKMFNLFGWSGKRGTLQGHQTVNRLFFYRTNRTGIPVKPTGIPIGGFYQVWLGSVIPAGLATGLVRYREMVNPGTLHPQWY